jgi:hypothetical protein
LPQTLRLNLETDKSIPETKQTHTRNETSESDHLSLNRGKEETGQHRATGPAGDDQGDGRGVRANLEDVTQIDVTQMTDETEIGGQEIETKVDPEVDPPAEDEMDENRIEITEAVPGVEMETKPTKNETKIRQTGPDQLTRL